MARGYEVWLRQAAFDYLDSLDLAERQRLLVWIERLGEQPDRVGDFAERGSDGRDWQGTVIATPRRGVVGGRTGPRNQSRSDPQGPTSEPRGRLPRPRAN